MPGPANKGTFFLNSIGLERTGSSPTLNIAGVAGTGPSAQLVAGTQRSGLFPVDVTGVLSRPAWVPGSNEVWVGPGETSGAPPWARTESRQNRRRSCCRPSPARAQITALRVSPEGSRVAMVLTSADGAKQLFVGSVVRGAGQIRIDTLTPVSPVGGRGHRRGVDRTDQAVRDRLQLGLEGHAGLRDQRRRSLWSARQFTLPDPPDSVTFAVGQFAWVSSGGFVWVQKDPIHWQSPSAVSQTVGSAPVYLE